MAIDTLDQGVESARRAPITVATVEPDDQSLDGFVKLLVVCLQACIAPTVMPPVVLYWITPFYLPPDIGHSPALALSEAVT